MATYLVSQPASRSPQSAIRIGLLIPQRGSRRAEGEEVRRGVEMAVAEANATPPLPPLSKRGTKGGVAPLRFELVVRADDGLWGAGSREVVNLIADDGVCALLGAVDSASAHVIEQIAMKARIVFVTPWASDSTLTQIGIPYMFRVVPDDRQQAEALSREIFSVKRLQRVGILVADDRSARLSADAFIQAAARSGHPIPRRLRWQCESTNRRIAQPLPLADILTRIERERLQGVALFASSVVEAEVIRAVQQRRMKVAVFSPISLLFRNPQPATRDPRADAFRRKFQARYDTAPTPAAAYAYDAARVLIRAVRSIAPRGRVDRAAVRDAVARTKFEGVTGTIQFDRKGNRLIPDLSS